MRFAASYTNDEIKNIIRVEQDYHPLAELTDYYKLFFQAFFGQGHFVGSKESVLQYLQQELSQMQGLYLPLKQEIGNDNGLYRISLSILQSNYLSVEELADRFCTIQTPEVDWNKWKHQWTVIESILHDSFGLSFSQSQVQLCMQAIESQELMSHSETFRLTYKPHYRVMQLNWDDKLLKKLRTHL